MKPSTLFLSLCFGLFTTAAWAALKPGHAAPDFTVDAALGGKEFKFSLAEVKKGPVVLYFYPKSFTSVCTVEAHEFAKNIKNFATTGASVIGLSGDRIEVQRDFSTKECHDNFPVGADPSFSVIKAYDAAFNIPVVGSAFANRISYVISPEGKILYAYSDSNAEKHIENTLAVGGREVGSSPRRRHIVVDRYRGVAARALCPSPKSRRATFADGTRVTSRKKVGKRECMVSSSRSRI